MNTIKEFDYKNCSIDCSLIHIGAETYTQDMEKITLWTIQPFEMYERLKSEKILVNNGSYLNNTNKVDASFFHAYKWMAKQMDRRFCLRTCKKKLGQLPFWGWYKWNGKKEMPPLDFKGHLPKGTKGICMKLELLKTRVLLSNFEIWHSVLNNQAVDGEIGKENSWDKVFTPLIDSDIQGTFWELKLSDLKKVWNFTAR